MLIKNYVYHIKKNNQITPLDHEESYKDLGVTFDEKLTFRDHIHDKVHKAYAMLEIIKRNFKYISINSFILLYKSMVRSLLDYFVPVWVPYKKGDIEVLEKVQKKATKIIPEIRHLPYIGNVLKHVSCHRYVLDKSEMIEMYKILTGKYDVDVAPKVLRVYDSTTRSNFKLNKGRAKYDLPKFYFINRVVNVWNSLPDHVVLSKKLTLLNHDLINFGNIKISKQNFTEPEVAVYIIIRN